MKTFYSPSKQKLENQAVKIIKLKILEILKSKPLVVIGIPGGKSVKNIFKLLARESLPWKKIHFFFVDERFVPIRSKKSNFYLAKKYLKQNLHAFNYKKPISQYTNEFKKLTNRFDIIVLGLGEDSHIASLFPEKSILDASKYFIRVGNSPKPPKNRISASRKFLENSKTAILFAFGKNKQKALDKFMNTRTTITSCPAKAILKIKDSYLFTNLN